jgi:hypothetical protein
MMAARRIVTGIACAACLLAVTGVSAQAGPAAPREAIVQQVDAAMLQARRMLHALVQGDPSAFDAAHLELLRLEADLRRSPGVDSAKVDDLDNALTMAALSRSAEAGRELQRAARGVIGADPAP